MTRIYVAAGGAKTEASEQRTAMVLTDDARGGQVVRIGARRSDLALMQARQVLDRLRAIAPYLEFEIVGVRTEGDVDKTTPLEILGGRGVFASALQEALLAGSIDLAVHSAKDVPPRSPDGLVIAAYPEREDPRDVLVSRHRRGLTDLPANPVIGTSSRRRATQILAVRPDARIVNLRGNIDTRLRKAASEEYDAIVVAAAGVVRMGQDAVITEWLPLDRFLPAPGQGALAVEARADDEAILALAGEIDDPAVHRALDVERAFLETLGAGCTTPVGANALVEFDQVVLRAMLADQPAGQIEWLTTTSSTANAVAVARRAAADMLARFANPEYPLADAPLAAKSVTVLNTRPLTDARALNDQLQKRGARVVSLPMIRIEPVADPRELDRVLASAVGGAFDLIVFTSQHGVEAVAARLAGLGIAPGFARRLPAAVVGETTGGVAKGHGFSVAALPPETTAAGLVAALLNHEPSPRRVLFAAGNLAKPTVEDGLRAAGWTVDRVTAYVTRPETEFDPAVLTIARDAAFDVVLFASPSAIEHFARIAPDAVEKSGAFAAVCIGPTTATAARSAGFANVIPADRPDADAMLAAVHAAVPIRDGP